MNNTPQLILDLLTILEYVLFVVAILKVKIHITTINKRFLMVPVTTGIYLVMIFRGVTFLVTFLFLQAVIVSLLYVLFHATLKNLIKMWMISLLIITMIEIIVRQMIIVFGIWNDRFTERFLCVIFIICVLCLYYILFGRKVKASLLKLPLQIWLLVIILLGIFLSILSYFLFFTRDVTMKEYVKTGVFLTIFAGIATVILIILFVHYFQKTQDYRLHEQLAREYNEQQKEYFTKMLEKEQDTRRFRHDIANHLLVVKSLCQKNEYDDVESYIAELLEDIKSISGKRYDVGNEIINIIINYYFVSLPEKVNVKVRGYIGEIEMISQKDMCALVSNLVKNTVEAVKDMENAQINFTVRRGTKFVCIELENSYKDKPVFDKNRIPKTSKSDSRNHGWGLQIVREVVDRYHGEIRYFTEKGKFKTEVYFPL